MRTKKLTIGSLKAGTAQRHFPESHAGRTVSSKQGEDHSKKDLKPTAGEPETIVFSQNDKVFKIPVSSESFNLLNAALALNKPVNYKCGAGTCGKCAVNIIKGEHCLAGRTEQEKETLKKKKLPGFRLACQSVVKCN